MTNDELTAAVVRLGNLQQRAESASMLTAAGIAKEAAAVSLAVVAELVKRELKRGAENG